MKRNEQKQKNGFMKQIRAFFTDHFSKFGKQAVRVCNGSSNFVKEYFSSLSRRRKKLVQLWNADSSLSKTARLKNTGRYLFETPRRRRIVLTTALNCIVPVVAIVVAVNLISGLVHTEYAFAVTYNGVDLGYIEDETVYSDAAENMKRRIDLPEGGKEVNVNAELSLCAIDTKEDEIVDTAELTNRMMENTENVVKAEGIYVDGKFIGAVRDIGRVQKYLDRRLEEYLEETGYKSAAYVKKITAKEGNFTSDQVISYADMREIFDSEEESEQFYTVVAGDTPLGIAAQLDMPYSDLLSWNPEIETSLYAGDQLLISLSEPYLSVEAVSTEVYTEVLPYKTVQEETDSMFKGESKVKREGKNGEQQVTAEVNLLNGYETGRTVLDKKTTQEPVDEIVLIGTKKPDPVTVPSNIHTNNGYNNTGISLSWPTRGGYISSGFGPRWGSYHRGLDIAKGGGCYGDDIFAAADGTVTYVGWCGSFGKLIKVSHGNGLETWYAHCSAFNVSVGQRVSRGQTIGYIGSTGRSTGPHLHFQVMLHGQYVNPLNYLK